MDLRAFLLILGVISCSCVNCFHPPYHYHQVAYAQANVNQQNAPLPVLPVYPVHLRPVFVPSGQIAYNRPLPPPQPIDVTPGCPNDLRQSRVFTKLCSIPGAVVDSLLSGQITV